MRNVFPDSNAYRLTVDPEITPEKAEAEQKERDEQRAALKDRKVGGQAVTRVKACEDRWVPLAECAPL